MEYNKKPATKPVAISRAGKGEPRQSVSLIHRYLIEDNVYEFKEPVHVGDTIEVSYGTYTVKEKHDNTLIITEPEEKTKKGTHLFNIYDI